MPDDSSSGPKTRSELAKLEARLTAWEADLREREERLVRTQVSADVDSKRFSDKEEKGETKIHPSTFAAYVQSGRFLRSTVFGGLDGLTTSMVLICSVNGIGTSASMPTTIPCAVVFTLGAANAIADAFSMGMGELLSSLAEGDTEGSNSTRLDAIRNGVVMFISFIIFGFVPLLAYVSFFPWITPIARLRSAWLLCVAGLFSLGVLKGAVTSGSYHPPVLIKTGLTMVATGGIASCLSYVISEVLHHDVAPLAQIN